MVLCNNFDEYATVVENTQVTIDSKLSIKMKAFEFDTNNIYNCCVKWIRINEMESTHY